MKKNFFFLFISLLLFSCSNKIDTIENAFYYWKSDNWSFSEKEDSLIDKLKVKKLYIKFFEVDHSVAMGKMGIPPVDKATLMCYNLMNPLENHEKNSILDIDELKSYLDTSAKYPLHLDVALPTYSWMHVYQNNQFSQVIYANNKAVKKILKAVKPLWFEVTKDTVINNEVYLRIGDKIKFEELTADKINKAIQIIKKEVHFDKNTTVTLFHLDEQQLSNYTKYINSIYTPNQVENLIADIYSYKSTNDTFLKWKYSLLKKQIPRLYDLLGTKYIRINNLQKALVNFKKVGNGFWNDKYSAWKKNENEMTYGSNIFDKNPFYELEYTPEFIPIKDTIRLNKKNITNQLIQYLNRANNVKEKDRDYYYFLAANCYYNMTQYGNSWMMRRFYWTSGGNHSVLEDKTEYYQCDLAKKYYLLAKENAKTKKFSALCLRMIGRCEKNKLNYQFTDSYDDEIENYDDFLLNKNQLS